jgi:homoserine dehydrogenase
MTKIRLGLLGGGTVGSGFLTLLHRRVELLEGLGLEVDLLPVVVRNPARRRQHEHPNVTFTSDPEVLAGADLLVEVMGGVDTALERVLPHLRAGKPLVTANKAMLAEGWSDLKEHAVQGRLYFEAAVMAGTPSIQPLATTLRASRPQEVHAVLSGTCGYILAKMEDGSSYQTALREAQELGYAEDPPTLDVGGWDAAHKLTVIARLTIDPDFRYEQVEVRGIDSLSAGAVHDTALRNRRVKLVGSLLPEGSGWKAIVRPVSLPANHPLAAGSPTTSTLLFVGDASGPVILSGGGAGSLVTASAVLGDVLQCLNGHPGHTPAPMRAAATAGPQLEALEVLA